MASQRNHDDDRRSKPAEKAAETTADAPEQLAIAAGTWPSPIDTFRTQVQGVALVGLIPTGDEKTAYPTGTPQAVGSKFWMRNGFYKSAVPT